MNDKDLRDAATITGSAPETSRNPEAANDIAPPVDSSALVTDREQVPTALPGGGPPPPPLVAFIQITSPQDRARIVGPGSGVPIILKGTYGAGDVGITVNISVKVSPRSSRTTYEFGVEIIDTNNWTSSFNTPEGGDLQVEAVLTVSSDDGRSRTVGNSILLLTNTTPPVFSVDHTSAHTDVSGNWFATVNDSQSTTIQVSGKASDPQFGVKEVVWMLDGGIPNPATTTDNWANWSANVPIQLGIHSLTFRCTDIGGNKAELTYQVTIARSGSIFSITPQDYLKALLLFATDPAISKGGQSQFVSRVTVADQNLTEKNLADAFYQPFGDLTLDTKQAKANEQVHQVRLCIQVLRKYLATKTLNDLQKETLANAEAAYRQSAYTALLIEIGTSYDEIRLARTEAQDKRQALADRLGIDLGDTRPDHLDVLFLAPSAITEASLEQLFGLVDTTRDPLSSPPLPNLQDWRVKYLGTLWQRQDFPDPAPAGILPLIDPDLLITSDFKNQVSTDPAFQLYTSRQTLVQGWFDALKQQHRSGAGLDTILSGTLNKTSADLLALDQDRQSGNDIKPQLETMNLALDAFNYLVRVSRLVQNNQHLLDSEWSDIFSLLVQVKKRCAFKSWSDAEKAANITQSPEYFQLSRDPVQLDNWRATEEARRAWQATLQGRIDQQRSIIEELQASVDAAEEATLILLRDALVNAIGDVVTTTVGKPNLPSNWNAWDWLTEFLLIDVRGTSLLKTTRVRQAIETLQSIFFSLRASRFEKMQPRPEQVSSNLNVWVLNGDKSQFDQEWAWMGSNANWQAAMRVFCYPENLLLPTLREDSNPTQTPTKPFNDLVDRLRNATLLTPADARAAATQYLKDLGSQPGAPPTITEKLDEAGLLALQSQIKNVFSPYTEGTPPHFKSPPPAYLQEVYFFVPMQLALELEHVGQFESALDWLRTVYAYNLPEPNEPRIYFGLVVDEYTQTSYLQTPHWLLDSLNPHTIATKRANSYTSFTLMSIVRCFLDFADAEFTTDSSESLPRALALYLSVLDLLELPELLPPASDSNSNNQMVPNPIFLALKMHTELNLRKLRNGRNIAGMQRQSDTNLSSDGTLIGSSTVGSGTALATPGTLSLQPTPYRYSTLIERAKQLVTLAQQMEASYLAALEKKDAETYTLLKAQQDLELANASVTLQNLRVTDATDGVTLANDQKDKAQIQVDHYQSLISSDLNLGERLSLEFLKQELYLQGVAALNYSLAALAGVWSIESFASSGSNAASTMAQAYSALAAGTGTIATMASTVANYERRKQEWEFQYALAQREVQISNDQVVLANDHKFIVIQEQTIAKLQANNAKATVDFLATKKFTNAELYAWMSGVLSRVYSYFLQQATAIARLAQNQLVFERQEALPSFIQANYWQAPSSTGENSSSNSQTSDRRGLTGSARLLQDIYRLDQHAFLTNTRKLQLVKTISLASMAPFEFQRFRATGVLPFATPMELFDRDFPGHYLRLIKRVRTSVIALIPPTQGIRATLTNAGVSRATIGGDVFRDVVVRRDPESIALSSPINATGLFELDTQPDMLLPFEGLGVDTSWQFQMLKAANLFDYDTIADVLITIEYTALNSDDLRQQVIQQLDRLISGDRAFSFRYEFADAWYDLNNPDQSSTPMTVRFETKREDFPPNIEDLTITQLVLYFVPKGATPIEKISVINLSLKQGFDTTDGGGADTKEGVISTRRGNAASWASSLCNTKNSPKLPIGDWTLVLPNTDEMKKHFENEDIKDILFVITYSGQTPKWSA